MRKRSLVMLCSVGVAVWAAALLALAGNALAASPPKVVLCHVPPGDPSNPQTIVVSESAVPAHLNNHPGDTLGECRTGCLTNAECDDNNLCTADVCNADGTCANTPVECDDGNVCTLDSCDPGLGCQNVPQTASSCDDGNACTGNDTCTAEGQCSGASIPGCCLSNADCDDIDECTIDSCDPATHTCSNTPVVCDDANQCTANICDPSTGQCTFPPISCDDANFCTDDRCDAGLGCVHTPTTSPPENPEVSCQDGLDNDCDGAVDAADPDCCAGTSEFCNPAAALPCCGSRDTCQTTVQEFPTCSPTQP